MQRPQVSHGFLVCLVGVASRLKCSLVKEHDLSCGCGQDKRVALDHNFRDGCQAVDTFEPELELAAEELVTIHLWQLWSTPRHYFRDGC